MIPALQAAPEWSWSETNTRMIPALKAASQWSLLCRQHPNDPCSESINPMIPDLQAAPQWSQLSGSTEPTPGCCGCSSVWQPARDPAEPSRARGCHCPLLPLPGMSACNPALLFAASEGKAPSLLLCSYHRCVAQGWIWPKFDLFIFPMLYRVLKPQVSKALNHMLNLKHMLKCLIRALLLYKAQSYDSIWSNWVEKLRFPPFSFAYLDVHLWAKLFTLNLFKYILVWV